MTDDEQPVRMTVDEIALMRAIIRWRKAHEIEFVRRRILGTYWIDAFGRTGEPQRSVAFDRSEVKALGMSANRYASYESTAVESVTQAVDLLVAYGYLPRRFSSAYRGGYDAGRAMAAAQDGAVVRPHGEPIPAVGYDEYGFPL